MELADQGSMVRAHDAMVTSVRNQVATRRWFTSNPSAAGAGFGCSGVLMLGFVWFFFGGSLDLALWLALPLIPVVLTSMVVRSRMRRGQRTGLGREQRKHGAEALSHASQPGLNPFVEGAFAAS